MDFFSGAGFTIAAGGTGLLDLGTDFTVGFVFFSSGPPGDFLLVISGFFPGA